MILSDHAFPSLASEGFCINGDVWTFICSYKFNISGLSCNSLLLPVYLERCVTELISIKFLLDALLCVNLLLSHAMLAHFLLIINLYNYPFSQFVWCLRMNKANNYVIKVLCGFLTLLGNVNQVLQPL